MNDLLANADDEHSSGDGESSERHRPNDHKEPPRQYFLPGKLIVHIDHPSGLDPRILAVLINIHLGHQQNPDGGPGFPTGVQQQASESGSGLSSIVQQVSNPVLAVAVQQLQAGNLNLANDVQPVQPQKIITFPRPEFLMPTFSIVPVELNRTDQQNVIDILSKINTGHEAKSFVLAPGVVWQSESPNWLLGSASHGTSHPPSPGSWPSPRKAPERDAWNFSLINKDTGGKRPWPDGFKSEGDNVHIAILDTAPCAVDLDEAYDTWSDENKLIEQLLEHEPQRKLRLVTNIYAEMELLDCSLARHRYWMADHGLFIAGEIANIAPKAKIHLIKAFTSYGSASTLTIAQGILRILDELKLKDDNPPINKIRSPLIVNCSFGLAAKKDDPDFKVQFPNPEIFEQMQTSLRALFAELTSQKDVIVVAAAGDDSDPETGRAEARSPAAYESVIGVGAMPRGSKPKNNKFPTASYSNLADNPPETGYVTLGGEPRHSHGDDEEGIRGILGLYVSEFPDYTGLDKTPPKDHKEATRDHLVYKPNKDKGEGNAEWAGASFAAPIITGILARWCSEKFSGEGSIKLADATTALNTLSQGAKTKEEEHVILVKQG